jgi:hypothetical protein
MPDRDYPPLQRRIAQTLRALAYLLAVVAGSGVLLFRPGAVNDTLSNGLVISLGAMALLAGVAALIGAALHQWQIEWVAAAPLGAAFGGYALLDLYWVTQGSWGSLAQGAALGLCSCLILARGVDLWVFSLTARAIRARRVALWRRVAELDG